MAESRAVANHWLEWQRPKLGLAFHGGYFNQQIFNYNLKHRLNIENNSLTWQSRLGIECKVRSRSVSLLLD